MDLEDLLGLESGDFEGVAEDSGSDAADSDTELVLPQRTPLVPTELTGGKSAGPPHSAGATASGADAGGGDDHSNGTVSAVGGSTGELGPTSNDHAGQPSLPDPPGRGLSLVAEQVSRCGGAQNHSSTLRKGRSQCG